MDPSALSLLLLPFAAGASASAFSAFVLHKVRKGSYRRIAQDIVQAAESDAQALRQRAELEAQKERTAKQEEMEQQWENERRKWQKDVERLRRREDKIEERANWNDLRRKELDQREELLKQREEQVNTLRAESKLEKKHLAESLEKLSFCSRQEAREQLLASVKEEVQHDSARLTQRLLKEARESAEVSAQSILAEAISRLAVPCVSEATVSTVALPGDDFKGRIIGREGRNIRALENATGANIIIDDTPGAIVVSCFDPVRRHIAKTALAELILDGRIHPTRIEEAVEHAQSKTAQQIQAQGEDACGRVGVFDLHPELIKYLGKLHFRHSYGQNILAHSLEVAHLLGMMAAELGLDVVFARRIGLLHDIGKAASHEVEGTHAMIGHDLALKYGESQTVANGIGCHHGEIDPLTVEASLCGTADALSASRPGARIEAVEEYVKRLRRLEHIAQGFPGVASVYALQAGREVRVTVLPEMIDDAGALNLARDISRKIEKSLSYPGSIKVTVLRERRAVHYAS